MFWDKADGVFRVLPILFLSISLILYSSNSPYTCKDTFGASVIPVRFAQEVAAGQPLEQFLRNEILSPLNLSETFFQVPKNRAGALAALYKREPWHGSSSSSYAVLQYTGILWYITVYYIYTHHIYIHHLYIYTHHIYTLYIYIYIYTHYIYTHHIYIHHTYIYTHHIYIHWIYIYIYTTHIHIYIHYIYTLYIYTSYIYTHHHIYTHHIYIILYCIFFLFSPLLLGSCWSPATGHGEWFWWCVGHTATLVVALAFIHAAGSDGPDRNRIGWLQHPESFRLLSLDVYITHKKSAVGLAGRCISGWFGIVWAWFCRGFPWSACKSHFHEAYTRQTSTLCDSGCGWQRRTGEYTSACPCKTENRPVFGPGFRKFSLPGRAGHYQAGTSKVDAFVPGAVRPGCVVEF